MYSTLALRHGPFSFDDLTCFSRPWQQAREKKRHSGTRNGCGPVCVSVASCFAVAVVHCFHSLVLKSQIVNPHHSDCFSFCDGLFSFDLYLDVYVPVSPVSFIHLLFPTFFVFSFNTKIDDQFGVKKVSPFSNSLTFFHSLVFPFLLFICLIRCFGRFCYRQSSNCSQSPAIESYCGYHPSPFITAIR